MSAGPHHTLLLTNENKVYACGMNIYGQCGMSTENDKITTPTEVFIDL